MATWEFLLDFVLRRWCQVRQQVHHRRLSLQILATRLELLLVSAHLLPCLRFHPLALLPLPSRLLRHVINWVRVALQLHLILERKYRAGQLLRRIRFPQLRASLHY